MNKTTTRIEKLVKKYQLKPTISHTSDRSWVEGYIRGVFGYCRQDIETGYAKNKGSEFTLFYKGGTAGVPRVVVALWDLKDETLYCWKPTGQG